MRRLPLILSSVLVLGACDSEGGDDGLDTDATSQSGTTADADSESSPETAGDPTGTPTTAPMTSTESGDPTGDQTGEDTTSGPSTDGYTSAAETGSDDTTGGSVVPQLPPGDVETLIAWLQAGEYDGWAAESAIHYSAGPHFGNVRTFFNNVLVDSFEGGAAVHPIGAANVKELYGPGQEIRGWAVMVKREVDAGEWYWFEVWDGDVLADTVAWDVCEDCHGDGVDNVLTPWPLQ